VPESSGLNAGSTDTPSGVKGVDVVRLELPAVGAYLSVLRSVTAGLAARVHFTLDEIEDLRIAVDEACALLLPSAAEGTDLACEFGVSSDQLRISVAVTTTDGELPARDSFAWTVLTALAGEVDSHSSGTQVSIDLVKHRTVVTA
jgi:serine/threonine-protein kinase RsbW